jgi:hypothetical protein
MPLIKKYTLTITNFTYLFKIVTISLILFAMMQMLEYVKNAKKTTLNKAKYDITFIGILCGTLLSSIIIYLDWLFIKRFFYFKANILTTSFFEVFINIAIFSIINVYIMALPELLFKKDKKCKKENLIKKL